MLSDDWRGPDVRAGGERRTVVVSTEGGGDVIVAGGERNTRVGACCVGLRSVVE